jgi:hypothetical protein
MGGVYSVMAEFHETTILNFSGLSSETKPTIAAGNTIYNGSRWREVDTGKIFHYDLFSDAWYETEQHEKSISGATPVVDLRAITFLERIALSLEKIEIHLSAGSETDLTDYEEE